MASTEKTTLDGLLEFVKETRGFDFTGYKRASIERRVAKRMEDVGVQHYDDYLDYLQLHGEEFAELFNTILINVTGFFRDMETWDHLADDVLPQIVAALPADAPLRIWCAGCSSGEEAYTIAMVVARVLGDDGFRNRAKIYATDVDEEALDYARHGAYQPRQVEAVPRQALERFFERTDQRYVFRKDLRRCVIFGRNDLVQDAPISHIDVLVCRNTLMYFTADTQAQILRRFHFALEDHGVLFLGKSEMLITHADLFTPVDLKRRVFRKVVRPTLRDRVRSIAFAPGEGAAAAATDSLREAAFEIGGPAEIVLDAEGSLVMANDAARRMFDLGVNDFGRPLQDLEISYRPIELRPHLDTLKKEAKTLDLTDLRWELGDQQRTLDVRLTPLLGDGIVLGTSVAYTDTTQTNRLEEKLASSRRELEQAYEELQSTVEELDTTNEELQSTNEELETTNEELQSTNEELETMNEELQSSNEELETMNDELRHRTLELDDINLFLEKILSTIGLAMAVVDRDQRVQIWNSQARDLWGLRADEAEDQHLLSLDIGLPLEKLRPQLRAALNGDSDRQEEVLDAIDRRGQPFRCRVTLLPLKSVNLNGHSGLILMMEAVS
ncbi:MAG TPA: CheR family methyltransferase [Solirubrobacteraceae bacterium]|jgi:two-component system CheB/CheR fusion protein